MMFVELLFWKNAHDSEDVRNEYNWKVSARQHMNENNAGICGDLCIVLEQWMTCAYGCRERQNSGKRSAGRGLMHIRMAPARMQGNGGQGSAGSATSPQQLSARRTWHCLCRCLRSIAPARATSVMRLPASRNGVAEGRVPVAMPVARAARYYTSQSSPCAVERTANDIVYVLSVSDLICSDMGAKFTRSQVQRQLKVLGLKKGQLTDNQVCTDL